MEFEKDIFISYAHIDNESFFKDKKGWVTSFQRALEIRVGQIYGKKPIIFRDQKLQGNDLFKDEIINQFPHIALFLSILSPIYVKSDWCLKEISTFIKVAQENIGLRIGNKSRIFKVLKTPIALENQPEPLREVLGYEFFKIDPETGRSKEFNQRFGGEAEQAYWSRLDDLAHDIAQILEKIEESTIAGDTLESKEEVDPDKTVYLAETSYDMQELRNSLKRELLENGYTVLPNQQSPYVLDDYTPFVEGLLEQCKVSIHLIGGNYGAIPENAEKSVVMLQNEIAAHRSKSNGLQRFIWLPPNISTQDERQKLFIEEIKSNDEYQYGADLLQTSLEDLKYAIKEKFESLKRQAEKPASTGSSLTPETDMQQLPLQVYLICDQRDIEHVIPLEDFFFDQGFEVITPVFEGNEADVRLDHQENLKLCDIVVIYHGLGDDFWLRSKIRDIFKIAGYGRTKKLYAKAVYLAAPQSPQKQRFRSRDYTVIDAMDGFSESKMKELINKISS